ncbi:MAG: LptF/LptG family permease [Candidatus Omnitrophota bacterium]
MKLTDRYIIRQLIFPFLYCMTSFIFLYIIIDLFGHLDEILRQKVPFNILLKYYGSYTAIIFTQTMPIATLVSTIYVLGNLNKHNEIIAMKASGISLWVILRPFLIVGVLCSLAVYAVNETIVPDAFIVTKTIKEGTIEKQTPSSNDAPKEKIIENVTIYGLNNQMIYARFYDTAKKTLINPIIMVNDEEKNITTKIIADKATWTDPGWIFYNCVIYNFDKENQIIGEPQLFSEKPVDIEEKPNDFIRHEVKTDCMNYKQLKQYIKRLSGIGSKITDKLLVDLYYKLSFPCISFIIILVGIPFAMTSKRGGALWGVGFSIAISLIYYGVIAVCIAFGRGGILQPIVSAWSANIIFAGLGLYLIAKVR